MAEDDLVLFTPEELARITAAIQEKAGGYKPCFLCGTTTWTVFPGVVQLTLQPKAPAVSGSPLTGTSNLMLLCSRCGNTVLLNVFALGLGDMFGLKSRAQELAEQAAAAQKAATAHPSEAKTGTG